LTEPRFAYLKGRVVGLFKVEVPEAILRESLELLLVGDRMAAGFVLCRGTPMPLDDAIDGLMEVDKVIAEIMKRGREKVAQKSQRNPSANDSVA
jgi:hypothetical protein